MHKASPGYDLRALSTDGANLYWSEDGTTPDDNWEDEVYFPYEVHVVKAALNGDGSLGATSNVFRGERADGLDTIWNLTAAKDGHLLALTRDGLYRMETNGNFALTGDYEVTFGTHSMLVAGSSVYLLKGDSKRITQVDLATGTEIREYALESWGFRGLTYDGQYVYLIGSDRLSRLPW